MIDKSTNNYFFETTFMKIFFSYPHDQNAAFVKRIKQDLEARGHEVWFDEEKIKTGDEWRNKITRGILDSQQVVAFLSKHSVRDPGVCLNEIAIALADKGEAMVTILVEPEDEVLAPVSVTHIQWLRMENWAKELENENWYRTQFDKLVETIEHPSNAGRNDELETLRLALDPMSFNADIAPHLPNFTGRKWIINRYQKWLADESQSQVLRIEGGPGLGKTAVSSYLAHSTKSSVLAVHLCQYNKGESRNPLRFVRTLAYQLATRLPDYRSRLLKSVAIRQPETMDGKDPASLWSELISNIIVGTGGKALIGRQRLAIIVDGLDEATVDGKNPIVELLVPEITKLPKWIGVVLTGRPDPELTQRLSRFQPLVLRDDDPENLADLKDYCDQWLASEFKGGRLTANQAVAATQTLLQNSHGAFLYLTQARIAATEGMLDLTQPGTFPGGLSEIYQRFFERRFPDAGSDTSTYASQVRPLLELVLASPEPLPRSLAADILQWDEEYADKKIIQKLGSLIKRTTGGLVGEDEETFAPFHNSVREWLRDADASGDFFVSTRKAKKALAAAIWQRYLTSSEQDAYAWAVLPDLLPALSSQEQDQLFGELTRETSLILYRLADSLAPKLRFSEACCAWAVLTRYSERLAAAAPENPLFARNLGVSYNRLGDMQVTLNNPQAALEYFQKGLEIADRLAATALENTEFARDLSINCYKLGDMQVTLNNPQAALEYFQRGLEITTRLATAAPDNVLFVRDLSIGYEKLGDMQVTLNNLQAALKYFQQGLEIAARLAAAAPENSQFARDLSINYYRLGDIQVTLNNPQTALAFFQKGLGITTRLASTAPDNAQLARDLSISYDKLGNMQVTLNNPWAALDYFQQGLEIATRLAAAAPENAEFARDLSVSYNKLGNIQLTLSNPQAALDYFQQGMEIATRLAAAAPENAEFARDLSVSYGKLGDMQAILNNPQAALAYFQQGQEIAARLAAAAPENAEFARDLSVSYNKLGNMQVTLNKPHAALDYFLQGMQIAARLAATTPENAELARDLSISFEKLGDIQTILNKPQAALAYFRQGLEIRTSLAAAAPENGQFLRDLAVSYAKLAQASEGQAQITWWRMCYKQFKDMESRGILAESDKSVLDQLEQAGLAE